MKDILLSLSENLDVVLNVLYIVSIFFTVLIVIFEKRNPQKTITWALVIILIPVLGLLLYLFLGQDYRKKKILSVKGLKSLEKLKQLTRQQLIMNPSAKSGIEESLINNKHIAKLLLANSDALVTTDNELQIINSGKEKFEKLFSAISAAKHHIHLEYYIVENGEIGNRLRELLIEKSKEGIEVRFIYDDVGSWSLSRAYIKSLRNAGVEIHCFMRIMFPHLTSKANYRNHRKIAIIDGEVGFVGGINIADRYINGTTELGEWRDTHLMLTGSAVTMLQIQFKADWYFVSKNKLSIEKYFKPIFPQDIRGKIVQILTGGPDSDWETIKQFYFSAITSARKHIYISTPYLIPTSEITSALKIAALAKIDVKILLPEVSDGVIPKWSTYSYIDELIEAGVKVYFYQPGFMHSKLIMIDSQFCSIGTANFDFRSLETNFEINAVIYNEETTTELEQKFIEDIAKSKLITTADWNNRPNFSKVKEAIARIFSPLL